MVVLASVTMEIKPTGRNKLGQFAKFRKNPFDAKDVSAIKRILIKNIRTAGSRNPKYHTYIGETFGDVERQYITEPQKIGGGWNLKIGSKSGHASILEDGRAPIKLNPPGLMVFRGYYPDHSIIMTLLQMQQVSKLVAYRNRGTKADSKERREINLRRAKRESNTSIAENIVNAYKENELVKGLWRKRAGYITGEEKYTGKKSPVALSRKHNIPIDANPIEVTRKFDPQSFRRNMKRINSGKEPKWKRWKYGIFTVLTDHVKAVGRYSAFTKTRDEARRYFVKEFAKKARRIKSKI